MTQNLYRCTPRQLRGYIEDCLYAGLVPFVQGSPGVGKSTIMRNVAKSLKLMMIDHRLSTSAPEDLSGLPRFDEHGHARFSPFADLFPLESRGIPTGYEGWLLFLDEFNSAKKEVQAASYKLILDHMVGQHRLHPNCVIAAAGNLATDRAITNVISTAMQSRVVHLELEVSFEEWLYDVAFAENYDNRIIAYLSQYPSKLMDFRPDHNEKTFSCPRTWEFTNRLVNGQPDIQSKAPLLAGTITSGVAVDFIQFSNVFQHVVKVDEIIRDPANCRIPGDNPLKWATICAMMEGVNDLNFDKLTTYADRYSMDFRVLFYRSVMVRQPGLRQHPAFARAMGSLSAYLHG